jgi:glycosyltransferase involved in cell wall biosynthesis
VNDGSTDRTSAILDEYAQKDSRITVFIQENQGPGAARNTALDNAKGKYILFCDSDDTLEPDAAFECSQAMENNNVDVVMFISKLIEVNRCDPAKKNLKWERILNKKKDSGEKILNQKEFCAAASFVCMWGCCYRLDLINCYKVRFPHTYCAEDVVFLNAYLMVIQTGYILEKCLYTYYSHKESMSYILLSENRHPFLNRLFSLPFVLIATLKFAIKNKILWKEMYVFYWLILWIRNRI